MITPALAAHRLARRQRLMMKAQVRKEARIKRANEAERQALLRAWDAVAGAGFPMPMSRHSI